MFEMFIGGKEFEFWNRVIKAYAKITPISISDSWELIAIKLYLACGSTAKTAKIMCHNNMMIPGKKVELKLLEALDINNVILHNKEIDKDLIWLARLKFSKNGGYLYDS